MTAYVSQPPEQTVIKWGLYTLPCLALVASTFLPFGFTTPKAFLFRAIVEILFVTYLFGLMRGHLWPDRTTFRAPVASYVVFVIVLGIATVAGVNPARSMWGGIERMEGLFQSLHHVIFLILMVSVFSKEDDWLWFFRISLGVSLLVAMIGISEWASSAPSHRPISTLGNPAYLGGYLLVHIFLGIFFAWKGSSLTRGAYLAVVAVESIALVLTATRASALGLVFGLVVVGGLLTTLPTEQRTAPQRRFAAIFLGCLIVIGAGAWGISRLDFISELTAPIDRMTTVMNASAEHRLYAWEIALSAIRDKPVLGWGPNNFDRAFNAFFQPRSDLATPRDEDWWDRTHNVILDLGISSGIAGIIAFLTLLGIVIWVFYRCANTRHTQTASHQKPMFAMIGLVSGYFVNLLFIFPVLVTSIPFLGVIGYANYHSTRAGSDSVRTGHFAKRFAKPVRLGIACIVALTIFALYKWTLVPMERLHRFQLALPNSSTVINQAAIDRIKTVMVDQPFDKRELRFFIAQMGMNASGNKNFSPFIQRSLLDFAATELRTQIALSPQDLRPLWDFADVLYQRALVDPSIAKAAVDAYRHAIAVSPKQPQLHMELADSFILAQDLDSAERALQQVVLYAPRWIAPRVSLVIVYIMTKQEKQLKLARETLESLVREQRGKLSYTEHEAHRIASTYQYVGNSEMAAQILNQQ